MTNPNIEKVVVNTLPPEMLKHIPPAMHNKVVDRLRCASRTQTAEMAYEELNFRYIFKQLGLELAETDNRELWYVVLQRMGGKMDLGSKAEQIYSSFVNNVLGGYYERLSEHLHMGYWALAQEHLGVVSKAKAILYDLEGNTTLLDIKTIADFFGTPFFLIIAEKDIVIKGIMKDLSDRGYKVGFYGIVTGGYASTNVVRLLMHLKPFSDRFYVFVAHDLDVDGLKIVLDLKRYFACESIGVNPGLLTKCGVAFASISQVYNSGGAATPKQIAGFHSMLDDAKLPADERKLYQDWFAACKDRRAELNALTALRERADPFKSKVRDLVDELERLLDGRVFDLNRYREPRVPEDHPNEAIRAEVKRPSLVDDIIADVKREATRLINAIINHAGLGTPSDLFKLVESQASAFEEENEATRKLIPHVIDLKKKKFMTANASFEESLKEVRSVLLSQDSTLNDDFDLLWSAYAKRVGEQEELLIKAVEADGSYQTALETLESYRSIVKAKIDEARDAFIARFPELASASQADPVEYGGQEGSRPGDDEAEPRQEPDLGGEEVPDEPMETHTTTIRYKCSECGKLYTETREWHIPADLSEDERDFDSPSNPRIDYDKTWDEKEWVWRNPDGTIEKGYIDDICEDCEKKQTITKGLKAAARAINKANESPESSDDAPPEVEVTTCSNCQAEIPGAEYELVFHMAEGDAYTFTHAKMCLACTAKCARMCPKCKTFFLLDGGIGKDDDACILCSINNPST